MIKKSINKYNLPVLIDWFETDGGHWSVVKSINDKEVCYMDPKSGTSKKMPTDKFEQVWFDFESDVPKKETMQNRVMVVIFPD
jgi:ABC-type bacteriocin/lantibiotic exporter with double-glycine peptidase domain